MDEILMATGKNVTFRNVLSRVLELEKAEGIERSARMFEAYIRREGLEPYGPLIIRNTSRSSGRDDVQYSEMLVQLRDAPVSVADPYRFTERIRLEGCLMARYSGPMDSMRMAFSKAQVYAFENSLDLGSVTYTVLVQNNGGSISADIFFEVLRWWNRVGTTCGS